MSRYLIKTRMRVIQAQSSAQLVRLAKMGLVPRDAKVKELPDGAWVQADQHPEIGQIYGEPEKERTVVATLATDLAARHAARSSGSGLIEEKTDIVWVRTDISTVEVRGRQVLQRLCELGVVRRHHAVSHSSSGPFEPLEGHPTYGAIVAELPASDAIRIPSAELPAASPTVRPAEPEPAPTPRSGTQPRALLPKSRRRPRGLEGQHVELTSSDLDLDPVSAAERAAEFAPTQAYPAARSSLSDTDPASAREVSVVISLSEEELEYFQEDAEPRREISNVILLSATDLQLLSEDLSLDVEVRDEEEVILLGAEDIEEFEDLGGTGKLPVLGTPWEQFRRSMNSVNRRQTGSSPRPELTWDLFRSMMDRPKPERSGPSETSWHRFQARLAGRAMTPAPTPQPVSNWDMFRLQMEHTGEGKETTWERFVRSVRRRVQMLHEAEQKARPSEAIAGEAPIRSGVVRVATDESGPRVHIEGLNED